MTKLITMNLPIEWINQLDIYAAQSGRTRAQLIRAVLKKHFSLTDIKVAQGRPKASQSQTLEP
jgi:predicted DNA-binding protein